ncbi:putative ATP-dependent Lon-type protease, partial [Thaumarchaeota archaeon SCGC AB-539-E09]
EKNYNMIELGPRGTGKSFIFREISPYVILLSGGQGSIPDLFGWKNRRDKPGLVLKYDVVAFDEVAGPSFQDEAAKQMYKGYMEQGSFARGDDKGTLSADAGIVFIGNLDSDVETTIRMSHLFSPLPDTIRNDLAFHDRWHAYFPGWEIPYMKPDYFTSHMGFIADYMAEIFHTELRKVNYTDAYQQYFELGSHVEERDRRAIVRTLSGFIKLLHPDGNCPKEDMEEILAFAIELRRRVKEQLKRMGGLEYSKTDLSYIDKETGDETVVYCREPMFTDIIPERTLLPGDVFTVGFDRDEGRYALFRVQTSVIPGKGGLSILGINSRSVKEGAKIAFDLVNMNAKDLGIDQDLSQYTFRVQVTSPMHGRESPDLGVPFYLSFVSSLLNRPMPPRFVVLGNMNLHGEVSAVEGLESKIKIAYESGARSILAPIREQREYETLPSELINSIRFRYFKRLSESVTQIFPSTRKYYDQDQQEKPYEILKNLESELREFIQNKLQSVSKNWWNERVPQDVRKNAEDRKESKTTIWPWTVQENLHQIHYINFPEYSKIITKRDNWKEVFSEHFMDREIIASKLRELEPVRNKIAHMRDLSESEISKLKLYSTEIRNCLYT